MEDFTDGVVGGHFLRNPMRINVFSAKMALFETLQFTVKKNALPLRNLKKTSKTLARSRGASEGPQGLGVRSASAAFQSA
jgi:hypothetical protein